MSKEVDENLVKVERIAKIFGMSVRRVQQLTQEGIIETVEIKQGSRTLHRYDLWQTVSTYIKHLSDKAEGRTKNRTIEQLEEAKLQAEIDYKEARAKMEALKLDELEGRMHSADDVEAMTTDLCLAVRSALLSLPGRLSVDVSEAQTAAEVSEIIKAAVNDILEELSRYEYDPKEYGRRVRERQGWVDKIEQEDEE